MDTDATSEDIEMAVRSVEEDLADFDSFMERARPEKKGPLRPLVPSEVFGETAIVRTADLADYEQNLSEASPDYLATLKTDYDQLSWRHHRIAQLLAVGSHSLTEISEMVGLTLTTIRYLRKSPAFVNLVQQYQLEVWDETKAVQQKVSSIRDTALDKLEKEIEENRIRGKDLAQTAFGLLDRTGHGPSKTVNNFNTNTNVDEETLDRIRERHDAQRSRIIDITQVSSTVSAEKQALSGRTPMGEIVGELPVAADDSGDESSAEGGDNLREEGGETPQKALPSASALRTLDRVRGS